MKFSYTGLCCAAIAIAIVAAAAPARAIVHAIPGSCTVPNSPATIVAAYPAEWPAFGMTPLATGEAVIRVDLRADNTVQEATIVKPIGDFALDRAARQASMKQKYATEIRECVPVEGSYLVHVAFES